MRKAEKQSRNHLVWIGMLISILGLVSYFTTFARFPALRDFPWVNLPLVFVGLGVSIMAMRRRLSFGSAVGALLSAAVAGLFVFYVFVLSNQVPNADRVVKVGAEAPAFSHPDQFGADIDLADFRGQPVVLVFYRGFW